MGHFYCLLCKNFTGHEGSFYFNDNKLWVDWDCIENSIIRIIIILLAAKNDIYWLCVLHICFFVYWVEMTNFLCCVSYQCVVHESVVHKGHVDDAINNYITLRISL